jgi:hypothetical protein
LIVLYFAIFIAAIGSTFVPEGYSPELAEAYAKEPDAWLMQGTWMPLIVVSILLIPWLTALIGLFCFKRWSRSLAVLSTLASLLIYPFVGADLSSGLESGLYETHATLWGAILAIAYFSPLSERFTGRCESARMRGRIER